MLLLSFFQISRGLKFLSKSINKDANKLSIKVKKRNFLSIYAEKEEEFSKSLTSVRKKCF